jgi:hypothetical protein
LGLLVETHIVSEESQAKASTELQEQNKLVTDHLAVLRNLAYDAYEPFLRARRSAWYRSIRSRVWARNRERRFHTYGYGSCYSEFNQDYRNKVVDQQ